MHRLFRWIKRVLRGKRDVQIAVFKHVVSKKARFDAETAITAIVSAASGRRGSEAVTATIDRAIAACAGRPFASCLVVGDVMLWRDGKGDIVFTSLMEEEHA